ncbi:MAG: S-layer homology domain-containing protein, partial [Oscillospiraceae bacterium]
MKKRFISIILVLVFAFSISAPVFAGSFSDLTGHWAESYMEDLADRGYLSGYEDGTMRPDVNITACETLALLSRLYDLEDETLRYIASDYEEYVEDTVPSSLKWAYDEIEICLAAGIVTQDELENMDLTGEVEKETLARFIVRTMQLQSKADELKNASLGFDDADEISSDDVGSVAELVSLGIITGDDNNNFSPKLSVTRAVVATVVSRSLVYLEDEGTTLVIDAYDGLSRSDGIITSVNSGYVDVCGFDGLTREYTVSDSASVTVNGANKTLTSLYTGCYVTVSAKEDTVTALTIDSDSDVTWVQGKIYSTSTSSSTQLLYVADLESGDRTKYTIPSDADITEDGKKATLSSLNKNDFVILKLDDDDVAEVYAASGDCEQTGDITEITYGTTVALKIQDSSNMVYCFALDISDLPTILRGETKISLDRLSAGDAVTVTVENCAVASIVAEGSGDTITGELTSVVATIGGTKWIITSDDGTTATLTVDENAGVYNGDTAILLSDIQVGDTISVVVYGSTITEIYLKSAANSSSKVSGTVLAVATSDKVITVLTDSEKLIYIDASSAASIINASTGNTLKLSAIPVNSELVAFG